MTGMLVHKDDVYANPIRIGDRVVGTIRGTAPLPAAVETLAAIFNSGLAQVAEIHSAPGLLPSEMVGRKGLIEPRLLAAAHANLTAIARHGPPIRREAATLNYVQPTASQPAWVQAEDIALAARFAAMGVAEQTQVVAKAMVAPADYRRWVECLLRVPRELTGLDQKMGERLRLAMLEQFDPAALASLQVRLDQLAQSERAQQIAEQVLAETFHGSVAKLRAMPINAVPLPAFEVPGHVMADLTGGRINAPTRFAA